MAAQPCSVCPRLARPAGAGHPSALRDRRPGRRGCGGRGVGGPGRAAPARAGPARNGRLEVRGHSGPPSARCQQAGSLRLRHRYGGWGGVGWGSGGKVQGGRDLHEPPTPTPLSAHTTYPPTHPTHNTPKHHLVDVPGRDAARGGGAGGKAAWPTGNGGGSCAGRARLSARRFAFGMSECK